MSMDESILKFKAFNNPSCVYSENNKVFVLAETIDAKNVEVERRFVLGTYPEQQKYLKTRFELYLKNNYVTSTTLPDYTTEFQISEYSGSLLIMYCYTTINQSLALKDKSLSDVEKNNIGSQLENYFSYQSFKYKQIGATETFVGLTFPEGYVVWNYCILKNSNSVINDALSLLLKSQNRKGTWIKKESETYNDPTIKNVGDVKIDKDLTISNLESTIVKLYEPKEIQESYDGNEINFFVDDKSSKYGPVSFFLIKENAAEALKNKLDNKVMVGFPEELLKLFPTIQQSDKKTNEIFDTVSYSNIEDIENKIKILDDIIKQKEKELNNTFKLSIDNFEPLEVLSQIKNFISYIKRDIDSKNISTAKNLNFSFLRKKCASGDQYCNKIFVDGQTNLKLDICILNNNFLLSPISSDIDERLSASFFIRLGEIILESDKKNAKEFFIYLYNKTVYSPYQGIASKAASSFANSTFISLAVRNAEKTFITDPVNIVNQYKARSNIEKIIKNSASQSPVKTIEQSLQEIRNLKQLFNDILDRYHLTDLVNEAISCYISPSFKELGLSYIEKTISDILKKIQEKDKNANDTFKKIQSCLGLKVAIPFPIPSDWQINIDMPTNDPLDLLLTKSIKCIDQNSGQDIKAEINKLNLPKIEQPNPLDKSKKIVIYDLNFLKNPINQQYDLIVQEAKTYKKAPGVDDEKKSAAALGTGTSASDFSMLVLRNAWILLQAQLEKEIERIIINIWKEIVQTTLDIIKRNCKNGEDKNKSLRGDKEGDLSLVDLSGKNQAVDDLINRLSSIFRPSLVCSLFSGSADDSTLEEILQIIKETAPELYIGPVVINGKKYAETLSTISAIRQFFILYSNDFQEYENKCKNYFDTLSNEPYPINSKCIDLTAESRQNRINKLVSLGLSKEQAAKIVDKEIKKKTNEYIDLLVSSENGIYNQAKQKVDNQEIKVPQQVKKSIEKTINSIITNYINIILSYKEQLLAMQGIDLAATGIFEYDDGVQYKIFNQVIQIFAEGNKYEPSYKFQSQYGIVYESKNYLDSSKKQAVNIKLELQKILEGTGLNIDGDSVGSSVIIKQFLNKYRIQLNASINENYKLFIKEDFEKELKQNMLSSINNFIYFEE